MNTIFITALPAAGKTVATGIISDLLQADKFHIDHDSDKAALIREVKKQIKGVQPNEEGVIVTPDTILLNPHDDPFDWRLKFPTPKSLNNAHAAMFDELKRQFWLSLFDGKTAKSRELAYGEEPLLGGDRLLQSLPTFLQQLEERGLLHNSYFIDVQASFDVRRERNRTRKKGYIPDDEFCLYFKDGGFIDDYWKAKLGNRYWPIQNEDISIVEYMGEVQRAYESMIRPHIVREGNLMSFERFASGRSKEI